MYHCANSWTRYGFICFRIFLTLLGTFGAMPKCGNQDLRSHRDISWIAWSSSLGFESLDVIQVFIRRMQRGGNLCSNWEQMSSNKMSLGLSFVFGCVLVERAFRFEVIFFEVDYRMSVQICFVLSGHWTANGSKDSFHRVQSTHSIWSIKTSQKILYREIITIYIYIMVLIVQIIAVCSDNCTKHINSLNGWNVGLLTLKLYGAVHKVTTGL